MDPKSKSLEPYAGVPSSLSDEGPIGLCYFDLDLRYLHINQRLAAVNALAVNPARALVPYTPMGYTLGDPPLPGPTTKGPSWTRAQRPT